MSTIFVMLPCFNEEKDIAPLVHRWINQRIVWEELGFALRIYCIDDKSTDSTNEVIRSLRDEFPRYVFLIEHKANKGLGGGIMSAFCNFNSIGTTGDLLVLMDGDNTHDPVYALPMLDKVKTGSDCVIASRYCNGSETLGVPPLRLFLSWGARKLYSLLLSVGNVKDYTCGYRMYTYEMIDKALQYYGNNFVERRSFACMMEALYKLSLIGAKFSEVPFELQYSNKEGESKMRIMKTVRESFYTAFALRFSKRHKK